MIRPPSSKPTRSEPPSHRSSSWACGGKDITADALLTQRSIAPFVRNRLGHYHLTVKSNHPALLTDIERYFAARHRPLQPDRLRSRPQRTPSIWVTDALNAYLDFPALAQAFLIQQQVLLKKTGQLLPANLPTTSPAAPPAKPPPQRLLEINRGHAVIENRCHDVIDWSSDEDRSRIRSGHGPDMSRACAASPSRLSTASPAARSPKPSAASTATSGPSSTIC